MEGVIDLTLPMSQILAFTQQVSDRAPLCIQKVELEQLIICGASKSKLRLSIDSSEP